jgi:hypothetical protein
MVVPTPERPIGLAPAGSGNKKGATSLPPLFVREVPKAISRSAHP